MSKNIIHLFERYLSNTASDEEKRALNDWIATNPELQIWLEAQIEKAESTMDPAQQRKILENIHKVIDQKEKKRIYLSSWLKYAATIALILISAGSLFVAYNSQKAPNLSTKVEAMRGQKSTITLPDGTEVILNSESHIVYHTDYNKNTRTVELTGEAYFDVKTDQKHPFIVKAGSLAITAKGTSFNVRAYPDESYISTTLSEGKVEVKTPFETMNMLPNERIEYYNEQGNATLVKLENAKQSVGWLSDQLSFENATLAEVANILSRTYNISIAFSDESIKHQRFTGRIDNNSLHSVLRILSLTSPISYKIDGNKVVLFEVKDERKLFRN